MAVLAAPGAQLFEGRRRWMVLQGFRARMAVLALQAFVVVVLPGPRFLLFGVRRRKWLVLQELRALQVFLFLVLLLLVFRLGQACPVFEQACFRKLTVWRLGFLFLPVGVARLVQYQ